MSNYVAKRYRNREIQPPALSDEFIFFFFNDTATTEIYTLSLHDALPIWAGRRGRLRARRPPGRRRAPAPVRDGDVAGLRERDRKSTRLNSSHANISYAVFCLKKKNKTILASFHSHIYDCFILIKKPQ